MTAEISSSVAEKAVCWCDGRKKRSSFVIETRWRRSILSESQPVRQLGGGHSLRRSTRENPSTSLRACLPVPAAPCQVKGGGEECPPHTTYPHNLPSLGRYPNLFG